MRSIVLRGECFGLVLKGRVFDERDIMSEPPVVRQPCVVTTPPWKVDVKG